MVVMQLARVVKMKNHGGGPREGLHASTKARRKERDEVSECVNAAMNEGANE